MLEIEQKYAGADFAAIEERLRSWVPRRGPIRRRPTTISTPPTATSPAPTRLPAAPRRLGQLPDLQGPQAGGGRQEAGRAGSAHRRRRKRRSADVALLVDLGYRPVAAGAHRRHYHFQREGFAVTVCLDEVEGLKERYAEVEVVTPPERQHETETLIVQTAQRAA